MAAVEHGGEGAMPGLSAELRGLPDQVGPRHQAGYSLAGGKGCNGCGVVG